MILALGTWAAAIGLLIACSGSESGASPATSEMGAGGSYAGGGAPPTGAAGSDPSAGRGGGSGSGATTGGAGNVALAGNGGAAGAAAVAASGNGGNPSGITFDWPETVPGAAKPCKAGHYVGTFVCQYQPAGTPDGSTGGFPISGPIDSSWPKRRTASSWK